MFVPAVLSKSDLVSAFKRNRHKNGESNLITDKVSAASLQR